MQKELHAARAVVLPTHRGRRLRARADVAEQPRQQRMVDRRIAGGVDLRGQCGIDRPARLGQRGNELRVHIAPFGQAQERNEPRAARVHALAVRQRFLRRTVEELPERDQRQEIGTLVAKLQVRLIGRLLPLQRTLARIGHGQCARDHESFGQAAVVARGEYDASDPRVERQLRELASARRERAIRVDGLQLLQQLVTVGDRPRQRRIEERKRRDIAQRERRHPQDHCGKRAAQDFGIRMHRTRVEIRFVVEPDANAVLHAPAATGALVRRCLRDLFDLQQRGLVAHRIAFDAGLPAVDHVADARNRQRRFGHVGGEHDPAPTRGRKHALLLVDGQPRIQRQDFDRARVRAARERASQHVARFADFALAGQEDEDVARTLAPQILGGRGDCFLELLFVVRLVFAGAQRLVADFDRVRAARDGDDRRRPARIREQACKAFGIDRRRRDDELQVGAALEQSLQVAEQEVDVEAALVRLVDDDRVIARKLAVALRFGQENPVGHQLDVRLGTRAIGEADLVADCFAQRRPELVRNAGGDRARGDPTRLGMADQAALASPGGEADLRQLRRLARAGFAGNDDDRMLANRRGDVRRTLGYGQFGRIDDARFARCTRGAQGARTLDVPGNRSPLVGRGAMRPRSLDPRAQPLRIRDRCVMQTRQERFGSGHRTTFVLRAPVFALGTARRADWATFVLRTPVFALGTARRADWATFVLRTPVFALGTARRADWATFVLRTPVFALGTARRADWATFVLRTPVFALGTARRAHAGATVASRLK